MTRKLAVAMLLVSACFTPRSVGFGQGAASLAANTGEIAISTGLVFQTQTSPTDVGVGATASTTTSGYTLPVFEGNLGYGFTDGIGLNIHVSPAGLQPGVKLHVLQGQLQMSVLPELAFGAGGASSTTSVTSNGTTLSQPGTTDASLGLLAGLKILVSHASGVFGGIGYDYQTFGMDTTTPARGSQPEEKQKSTVASHNLAMAVGYELATGWVMVRPELALLFAPSITTSTTSGSTTKSTDDGSAWVVFPNVTFAMGGGRR